ncbi:DUF3572 domain-containing protein [Limoniibacter endophyticus]|uniref:DUF3572 family protein n=1 Tax=Limoniibacter endophyticus TaxID=1565040 RepID=A0A8J3DR77_9HYPH|nr:DUF3572 domain-containing protein [Limoniibacter endophyticus]GHC75955.1 hypothetical protein GCM10010136_26390 [Limoniibacter endophyticus]
MTDIAKRGSGNEDVAIAALGFIAADPELLPRFLDLSGIDASAIRRAAAEPGFLAGVLDFVLAHEPTLLRFCQEAEIAPEHVARARRALGGFDESHY